MKKTLILTLVFLLLIGPITSLALDSPDYSDREIVFADAGWDSAKFHNALAGLIAQELFGYSYREVPGSSTLLHEGIIKGEIDVNMEVWTNNLLDYEDDLAAGKLQDLGSNFADNNQGFYVPRYLIEGDSSRGLEALAPDLEHVQDLKDYWHLFEDDEDPSKGRIYGAIPGWEIDEIMHKKYLHYGLDSNFNYFRPGSDAALNSAITSAFEKGQPLVTYYWEPTWLMGLYDMVLLQDEPYEEKAYEEGATALPSVEVNIGTSNEFAQDNPELIEILSNYETSSDLTSQALAYMQEEEADYKKTALWFIKENSHLLDEWLEEDQAQYIKDRLVDDSLEIKAQSSFPVELDINPEKIDQSVRNFSIKHEKFFGTIKKRLADLVGGIHFILAKLPWYLFIGLIFLISWKSTGKLGSALGYSILVFLIGLVGLWDHMYETLSIVLASVVLSLILGFPLGILVSGSERADKLVRPLLDTMQTMPVFVYLIPALLFFGLGKPPAVIATTIYAIVPIIRLTNHGIRQIDKEVIEASRSFGSTKFQSLIKVEIPQALPTIMTGVNQTLMMAMSMVVTTSMIGATGLGMEVLISVNRVEIGRGLISGMAVVILAVILDRITQGLNKSQEEN